MDKYEYKLKSEQIKKLHEDGDFKTLLNVADSFDWRKITSNVLLNIVSDAYEKVGKIEKAYEMLLMAYERTTFGRNLAYRLCLLSLKLEKISEAVDFYTDFVRKAPKDPNQYILKYEILKAKNADDQDLIKALEAYLLLDIDEKWQYELAYLYHQSGQQAKCVEMCNQLSTWFSDSDYVKNALELKKEYEPLTAMQELKAVKNEEFEVEEDTQEYVGEGYETFHFQPDEQEMLMDVVKSISEFEESNAVNENAMNNEEVNDEEYKVDEELEDEVIEDQQTEEQLFEDQQIEGQLDLESLFEEKARILKEEIEKENDVELDGPFGDIFNKEVAEFEDVEEASFYGDIYEEAINNETMNDEECKSDEEQEEGYCLSPELRELFERYLPINKMEEQLAETLDNLINFYAEDGTSSTNNIVIMGDEKSGKTSLIIDIIKVINRERNRTGRKVAKIKGESLNRKGMEATMPKLFGADLIIERAGNLNPETVQGIIKAMKDYTEDMIVILEDSEVALERLFKVNIELIEMFRNVIRIKEVGVKEWVEIAKEYSRRRGYIVDEMGTLALHVKIGNVYSRELKLEADEIEGVIDEAIEKAKRKKRYSKKHRIEGFAVLREADFM